MKALILAAGRGKRLGQLTQTKNKCMFEVNGRPLIAASLNCASQLALSEIVIVVGYQAEDIKKYCGKEYKGIPIKYVLQEEQKGLVHAIECARTAIGPDDFFLFLGDELLINPKHAEMAEKFRQERPTAICGVIKVDNPALISRTYGIRQDDNGMIIELIEKPDSQAIQKGLVMKDIMGTGNCVFHNEIFSYIEKTPLNPKRGEKELPDLIQAAIKEKKTIKFLPVCDIYFNINLKQDESYFAHFSESDNHLTSRE